MGGASKLELNRAKMSESEYALWDRAFRETQGQGFSGRATVGKDSALHKRYKELQKVMDLRRLQAPDAVDEAIRAQQARDRDLLNLGSTRAGAFHTAPAGYRSLLGGKR